MPHSPRLHCAGSLGIIGRTCWRRNFTWLSASPVRRSQAEAMEPWRVVSSTLQSTASTSTGRVSSWTPPRDTASSSCISARLSLSLVDDGVLSFGVGLIGTDAAPRPPAQEAGDEVATATSAEASSVFPEAMASSAAAYFHPMAAAQAVAAATTEGLTLERANSASGFRFVQTLRDSYRVQLFHNGEAHSIGPFPTPQ